MTSALERFDFHGDALDVVRLDDGDVGAVLTRLCDVFALDASTQARKLDGLPWATTVKMTVVAADGRAREMLVLHRRSLAGWLFTLNAGKVRSELREKLAMYQREAADVLADHFLGRRGQSLAQVDQLGSALAALASSTAALTTMMAGMAHRLDAIESRSGEVAPATIGAAGAREIAHLVGRIVGTRSAVAAPAERARYARGFRSEVYTALRSQLKVGMRPRVALLPREQHQPAMNFLAGLLASAERGLAAAESGKQTELPLANVTSLRLAPDAAE